MIDGLGISCEIALIGMSLDFTDDQSTLVQVMAWCRQATSHYLSQCWPRYLSPYGVTRPEWVKWLCLRQVMEMQLHCFLVLLSTVTTRMGLFSLALIHLNEMSEVNSLRPCGTTWQHRCGSMLVLIMTYCLTALNCYLKPCCLIFKGILCHSSEGNIKGNVLDISFW